MKTISLYKITWYTVIRKLGLLTKQVVDDFPLGSIQTTVWVCNQLDYQTNPCDIYLFHLLILYIFQIITNLRFKVILSAKHPNSLITR
jgi:hypothetical protein